MSVGKALAHDSAVLHVQGNATYVDDMREGEGLLHLVPGYAGDAAVGQITKLDLTAVRSFPGVVAVLTAKDIVGHNECSPSIGGDPILADGEIFFHGQVIFAVVAMTRDSARRAARLAVIEIAKAKPVVKIADAEVDLLPPYEFNRGQAKAMIAKSTTQLSQSLTVGGQEHFYLEGQVALAVPVEQGGMKVFSSTQHPTEVQHLVARMLGVNDAQVLCECRRMGGAFGGKESQASQWACLAALAASKTGASVKCRLDRDDDMIMTGKRHDFEMSYDVGFDAKGVLHAVNIEMASRCGYSADLSGPINDRAMFHADNCYFYPAARIHSRRLKTNTVSNTAFRGFGGPQGMLVAEHIMQAIALQTAQDALDVRLSNLYREGANTTPYGMKVDCEIARHIIKQLEKSSDYRARRECIEAFNRGGGVLRKGLALTPVKFGISFTLTFLNQAGALIHLYTDGSVQVNHGGTEMGQGLYQKVAQVVATEFGMDIAKVRIMATATDKVPNTSATAASSGTDLNGKAAQTAVRIIKERIAEMLATHWELTDLKKIKFEDGEIRAGTHSMTLAEAAELAHQNRISLSSTGYYATPKVKWDRPTAKGRPFFYFACGAACSEVTIDTLTGEMKIDRVDILHDVGHSINPAIDIGQIEGGFVQGVGWLTTEELVYDADGKLRTHAPSTYKIPCASDVPEDFRVALYESQGNPEDTIFRSKAVGEPPLMLSISVWCAIYDAIASLADGALPNLQAPATPEAILTAVRSLQS